MLKRAIACRDTLILYWKASRHQLRGCYAYESCRVTDCSVDLKQVPRTKDQVVELNCGFKDTGDRCAKLIGER